MGKLKTFTRRAFLIGSVAVTGGVAYGAWQVARTPENPLRPDRGAALNPWLAVTSDGITVIVPRAEMGQGVQTTLAALVAEELDVDLDTIQVEHGLPAQAYFNSALLADRAYAESTEAPATGWGATLMKAIPKVMSLQVTGGSTSAIDAFYKMRIAGASARLALLRAAADRLGTPVDQLKTEAGVVIAPDGSRLPYGSLAEDAAAFDPDTNPPLKPQSEWRILGKSQPRKDQVPKATGTATFGMDVRLPGMMFASLRMNPRLGGTMDGFDDSKARAMAGVEKVVDMGNGVAVIARNTWLAIQAVNAIDVTWGDAPYPAETDAIFAKIDAAFNDKPNIVSRDEGDAETGLGTDAITAEYRAPYLAHATMEVMNSTALFTGDALEIWSPNQSPVQARADAAKAAGLKPDQVTLHTTFMGGGFGRRANIEFAGYAARIAAALPDVPVQTTWSREEDMSHDYYRPGAIARMRAKLDNGRISALDARMAAPSIMRQMISAQVGLTLSPADSTITEGAHDQPYAIPDFRVAGHAADVAIPAGFWRSVGNSQNAFFLESFIDELAHAAGADPLDFRLNHIRPEHEVSAQVIEAVRDLSGWTGSTPDNVGRGIAFTYSFGSPVAEVVEVVLEDGQIRLGNVWIAADLGVILDPVNIEAQLTGASVFGLSAALFGEITFSDGKVEQSNFPDYDSLRMLNVPRFQVTMAENNTRIGGVGEIGTPPAAPALANALFDLTGVRARRLPLILEFDFVQ